MIDSLALLLAVAAAPLAQDVGPASRFVLVIGHNGAGTEQKAPLRYADDDAARFFLQHQPMATKSWLLSTFDLETARAYPGLSALARPPSRTELLRTLGEIAWAVRHAREEGQSPEFVLYFAGHGDVGEDGAGFLVLNDGRLTRHDLFKQVLDPLPTALNHVIIDACASFHMVPRGERTVVKKPLSPETLDALRARADVPEDLVARTGMLVATSDAAEVHESSELASGAFSYLVRSALAGAADANRDGIIEYVETAAFIASASQGLSDERARVNAYGFAPAQRPHVALVDQRRTLDGPFLSLDGSGPDHIRVLDERGQPFVEVHREPGVPVMLSLAGSTFWRVQSEGREALLVPDGGGAYALSSLDFRDKATVRSQRTGVFAGLLSQPVGRGFLGGFLSQAAYAPPAPGLALEVPYAQAGAPPFRFPWMAAGGLTLGGAAALTGVAAVTGVLNLVAYAQLSQVYQQSAYLDPDLSLAVDGYRTASMIALVGAAVLAGAGAGLIAWDLYGEQP